MTHREAVSQNNLPTFNDETPESAIRTMLLGAITEAIHQQRRLVQDNFGQEDGVLLQMIVPTPKQSEWLVTLFTKDYPRVGCLMDRLLELTRGK